MSNLKEVQNLLRTVVEKSPALIFIYRDSYIYVNRAFESFTGYTLEELRRKKPWEIVHPDFLESTKKIALERLKGKRRDKTYRYITVITKSGEKRFAELITTTVKCCGGFAGLGIGIDKTEEKLLEEKLLRITYYDELTGLPNRKTFLMKLHKALKYAEKNNHSIAIILLDVRNFKLINSKYGFETGDKLLKQLSERLKKSVFSVDTVARIGADRFSILIYSFKDPVKLSKIIKRITGNVVGSYKINGHEIFVDVKMGITVFPKDGSDGETLLKNAEIALSKAKLSPDKTFDFYSKDYTAEITKILDIKERIRESINSKGVLLRFQPILDINTMKVEMAEVLVRLNSSGELLLPENFIPIAEQSGLINQLGNVILEKTLAHIRELKNSPKNVRFSLNISPVQLKRSDFCHNFINTVEANGVSPSTFTVEITETAIMENVEENIYKLKRLKSKGVSVAIDDFGKGYSSLNYLKSLPLDYLKIDSSFIEKIGKDRDYEAVVKTIISIAGIFNFRTIAEGIETQEQLEFLRENGCNLGQGFLFYEPLPFEEFIKLLP